MTGKPHFKCYLAPTMMDLHSTPEVELHKAEWQKISLHIIRQIQLNEILLMSQTHQTCQNHSPTKDYKNCNRCRGQIPSVSASQNAYQMVEHQNRKLISSYMWMDYSINMWWIQTRNCWLLSYQNHGNTQCLWKHMANLVNREQLVHTAS